MALRLFDSLLTQATPEEFQAINEIVSERDEFTVYSGLSRRSLGTARGFSVADDPAGKNFERRGVVWITALARVELGSILAALTPVARPFDLTGPSEIERAAYAELLLDGAQSHYAALSTDENLALVARRAPGTEMLRYIRRLSLVRHMLDAGARAVGAQMTPTQLAVVAGADRDLASMQSQFERAVQTYIDRENYSNTVQTRGVARKSPDWIGCTFMIRGAMKELKAGTARVYDAPVLESRP